MKAFLTGWVSSPSTSAVNYFHIANQVAVGAPTVEAKRFSPCSHPFKVTRLYVVLNTAPGGVASWTFTVRRNGTDTTITGTISGVGKTFDISGGEAFGDGDTIDVSTTPSGTPTAPGAVRWFVEFQAPYAFPVFGANLQDASASATNYASLQGEATGIWEVTEAAAQQVVPIACTLRNLRVLPTSSPGSGSYALTVYKNGSPTGVTVTVTSSSSVLSTGQVSFAVGDTVSIGSIPSGTPSVGGFLWSLECVPATDGQSFLAYGTSLLPSTSAQTYQQPNVGQNAAWNATEANRSVPAPSGYTLTAMYAVLGTASGAAKSWDVKLRDATANADRLTFNLANVTSGSLTGQSVALVDKNLIDFSLKPNSTPAAMTGGAHLGVALSGPTTTRVTGVPAGVL